MSRVGLRLLVAGLIAVAAAVRLNNAFAFPPLRGYDGYGHFTYIWYLAETGRIPFATSGWSFFHPPLYYAAMAALWNALDTIDPVMRLKIGSAIMSMFNLAHAAVSYLIVRRYLPGRPLIHLLAPGLMLFLPLHLYSSAFLGNEGVAAVLCSVSLLALLWVLARPSLVGSAMLGVSLGLAMLGKFSGLAVVIGAFVTIGFAALRSRRSVMGVTQLSVVAICMLLVCGWYYARNVTKYGTPFMMSRSEFMVQHVENIQTMGSRGVLEYVLFDPMIFRRPQWPRGIPLSGTLPTDTVRSAMREAVWTGIYANTWFDGFGGWVLPRVTESEMARRAGQLMLLLGLLPTLLVFVGIWDALERLWRSGWDDTLVAMLVTFGAMVLIFVHGTRVAPLHAAIKATYLMPVTVIFSFWFALGLDRFVRLYPRWMRLVTAECAVVAIASVVVFTQGLILAPVEARAGTFAAAVWDNMYGIVYYAGGERDEAHRRFAAAAEGEWHLGYENLAALAFEEGRWLESVYMLKRAAALEPKQSFGTPSDRRHFDDMTLADYLNSMAVAYHRLGLHGEALRVASAAVTRDRMLPEAHYNLGVLEILRATEVERNGNAPLRAQLASRALARFQEASLLDPGLLDSVSMSVSMMKSAQALSGECHPAIDDVARTDTVRPAAYREFPVETGRGIPHSAAIGRRKLITDPAHLQPSALSRRCEEGNPTTTLHAGTVP